MAELVVDFAALDAAESDYTSENTVESERRFLDAIFRRLRDTGRYSLFATLDVQVRIDPE